MILYEHNHETDKYHLILREYKIMNFINKNILNFEEKKSNDSKIYDLVEI